MSVSVLQLLSDKDNYDRFARYIKPHTVGEETATIITNLDKWYEKHGDVDWEDFSEWFKVVNSSMKPEKMQMYDTIFSRLEEVDEEPDSDIVEHYVNQDFCTQIAEVTLKGAEGEDVKVKTVEDMVSQWYDKLGSATSLSSYVVTQSLEEIADNIHLHGLQWRSNFLNQAVGNLRKGKLVCFAARPNTGKTTFLASEATFMAPQLEDDECVLWFNNEEDGGEVKYRTVQAALQCTDSDINADKIKAADEYAKVIGGAEKIVIVNKADASVKDVEEFIRMYKPGLIIFDQLWKVHGFERTSSTDTARLQAVFSWAREIAKKHAPVVTVHQLKTEADGCQWINPSQLYLSGTAIQGEVDTLILMGRTYDPTKQDERYVCIGKNKGAYGPLVDTSLREGRDTWTILPDKAMFLE